MEYYIVDFIGPRKLARPSANQAKGWPLNYLTDAGICFCTSMVFNVVMFLYYKECFCILSSIFFSLVEKKVD
jgi:hypothetical protein